jgi:hypothetical protein
MPNLIFAVFCLNILVYAASEFQGRGHGWADLICRNSFGLCNYSQYLLLAVVPLFIAAYVANKHR